VKNLLEAPTKVSRNSSPVERVNVWSAILFITALSLPLVGCKPGVQGGDLPSTFEGITTIEAVSPTAVEMSWELSKRYEKYNIYQGLSSTPIKIETFQSTIVTGLSAASSYQFSVTAVDATNVEKGQGVFTSIRTYSNFTGIKDADLTLAGPTTVNVTWSSQGENVTYTIYQKLQSGTWNLSMPAYTVKGTGRYQVLNLAEGTPYCFYVVANYKDGTSEPALTQTEASAKSGCISTTSDLGGLPVVSANPALPGSYPWFSAIGGLNDMTIDIYDTDTTLRVATRTGNGPFRAFTAQAPGNHKFHGIVSRTVAGVQKKAKIAVGIKNAAGASLTTARVRTLDELYSVTPRLVSGGSGVQRLGSQIIKGDFNCDGIPDLAVSAPNATPYVHPNHVSEMGAVVVYYGEKYTPAGSLFPNYRLKTDVAPSASAVAPLPQLIYYPVDYSNFHFGTKMVSGNFNGDCKKYDPAVPANSIHADCDKLYKQYSTSGAPDYTPDMAAVGYIYRCDDIAVAVNPDSKVSSYDRTGGVFVLYGDPNSGIVSGSGSANYGKNEATCDSNSGTCLASRYNHESMTAVAPIEPVVYQFGKSLAAGDLNNDGFEDLIVGGTTKKAASTYYGRVTVLRGSTQGLRPTSSPLANADLQPEASGAVYGPTGGTAAVPMTSLDAASSDTTPDFAYAVGAVPHSRTCVEIVSGGTRYRETDPQINVAGFDFSKCADLIVGDPSRASKRGSIVSCQANFSTAGADVSMHRRINTWTCREHWPSTLEAGAQYGFSVLGVDNQNGYPLTAPDNYSVDVLGALFVGAPNATITEQGSAGVNAGKVFGYYAVRGASSHPGIQSVLGTNGHVVQANPAIPCNTANTQNYTGTGTAGRCDHQVIYDAASQAGEQFGYSLGTGAITSLTSTELPKLLVGAPYRNIGSGASTVANAGAIFVFSGDNSKLGSSGTKREYNSGSFTYTLSGGVNPFGPSILYDRNVTPNSYLGLAGVVGDDFAGLTTAREVDVVTSAPLNGQPVEANGSVEMFLANSGFPTTMSVPSALITQNVSKEINYRFDQAKVVGDVNGDGYQDVIARIKVGSKKVETIIFYGSSSGLITSPTPTTTPSGLGPKVIYSSSDKLLGVKFFKAGDINGDTFADVFFIGENASYIYYGSLTGLISNVEPITNPVGKNPLKFGLANSSFTAITFHGSTLQGDATQVPPNYDVSLQAVAPGDFNADGYGDIAIGTDDTTVLPNSTDPDLAGSLGSSRKGRVTVIYGSVSGLQVGTTGYLKRTGAVPAEVVAKSPCSAGVCKIQQIGPTLATSLNFGWSLATVPSMELPTNKADGLAISDPAGEGGSVGAGKGVVYYLRGSINGLQVSDTSRQLIRSASTTATNSFGYLLAPAGDINGDGKADLLVSAPNGSGSLWAGLYVLYGGKDALGNGIFLGADTMTQATPTMEVNARFPEDATTKAITITPQLIRPTQLSTNTAAQFGYGIAGIGDFNGDGLADVAVNVPKGDYELDVKKREAGYAIIYFGTNRGLRSDLSLSTTPACYGMGTNDSVCEPYMFYLPNNAEYENTYMSSSAAGDINGDGYPDVIIGGFGRNHPSGQAFSSGVFYVFY
jgi:FG-GAP repeat